MSEERYIVRRLSRDNIREFVWTVTRISNSGQGWHIADFQTRAAAQFAAVALESASAMDRGEEDSLSGPENALQGGPGKTVPRR